MINKNKSGNFLLFCKKKQIPASANTATSKIAAYFDYSSGGSAEAFSQIGLMFNGFFEYPTCCAMSYLGA